MGKQQISASLLNGHRLRTILAPCAWSLPDLAGASGDFQDVKPRAPDFAPKHFKTKPKLFRAMLQVITPEKRIMEVGFQSECIRSWDSSLILNLLVNSFAAIVYGEDQSQQYLSGSRYLQAAEKRKFRQTDGSIGVYMQPCGCARLRWTVLT